MRIFFYIDGFNLYNSRLKRYRQFRWLNVELLAQNLVPENSVIKKTNFYTAYVSGRIDPQAVGKQQAYLAALKTLPTIEIFSGNFSINDRWVKLVQPLQAKPDECRFMQPLPEFMMASIPQEKGSDVKLGVHLVRDAFQDAFDVAYVITNDTDLVEPIKIVTEELGKEVVIVPPILSRNPKNPVPAVSLRKVASSFIYIEDKDLEGAQFPNEVVKENGKTLFRPESWVKPSDV